MSVEPVVTANQKLGYLAIQSLMPVLHKGGEFNAERMYIVGRSGSGKSFLAKTMVAAYSLRKGHPKALSAGVCVFDPNGTVKIDGAKIVTNVADVVPDRKTPVKVFRPTPDQMTAEGWNAALGKLYDAPGPIMLVIDEYTSLEPLFAIRKIEGGNMLTAYMSRGRARGKGAIILTQAPANVPLIAVRNADRYAIFDLPLDEDRVRMSNVVERYAIETKGGKRVAVDIRDRRALGKYEFWYARDASTPVRLKLKG